MSLLSLVVPFLNERDTVHQFAAFVAKLKAEVRQRHNLDLEVVLVDDGSQDDSIERYKTALEGDWRIVELSRNFGKEIALFAGIEESRGDFVMMVDADLQHPYHVCLDMIDALMADAQLDVVYTIRDDRKDESMRKAVLGELFYWLINARQRFTIPANAGDFRIMRRAAVDALLKVRDKRRFNKGLYAWLGFRQKAIHYVPDERVAGATKWSKLALLTLSLEGITSFTAIPLRLVSIMGLLVGLGGMAYGVNIIVTALLYGADVPGYPSLMSAVTVLGGFNLALLGLLGEYIWVAVGEVKDRPLYLVRRLHHSDKNENNG
ncbi:glycosyltransferase involved in cell wall biosynthesis [Agrobacterium vitis]|nr:glycosyltransferase involved in cell wall biosynthesis [Agrobacterium vitis]MBE1438447.1 glycosyltransferase involved in cell wall biosynthesis [Agrobacterium vitis]